jgi:hypothetical protein
MTDTFDTGVLPEDFPALGLLEGDLLCYQPISQNNPPPEKQAVIVRNVHNGKMSVGYVVGNTLYLATETIRNYYDWGAEIVAVVTSTQRNWWSPKF